MKSLKSLVIIGIAALAAAACSSSSSSREVKKVEGVTVTRSVVKDAAEDKCTAKIAVDGMSCAKMCGGSIKKCLKSIDGIRSAEIDFAENQDPDFATVEFDNKVVTEKEMITAIEKLNNGQYKVRSVEIVVSEVSYEKIDKSVDKKDEKPTSGKVTAFNTISIVIPNVFEILSAVIQ